MLYGAPLSCVLYPYVSSWCPHRHWSVTSDRAMDGQGEEPGITTSSSLSDQARPGLNQPPKTWSSQPIRDRDQGLKESRGQPVLISVLSRRCSSRVCVRIPQVARAPELRGRSSASFLSRQRVRIFRLDRVILTP